MTAPTEQEIRNLLGPADVDPGELIYEAVRVINYVPPSQRGPGYEGDVWEDLRPSEEKRLEELISEVYTDWRSRSGDSSLTESSRQRCSSLRSSPTHRVIGS